MDYKKGFTFTVVALTAAVTVYLLTQVFELPQILGVPLKTTIVVISSYTLYGVLALTYIIRMAFIFFGMYGSFRILREWYSRRTQYGIVL